MSSTPGEGTTFTIDLPRYAGAPATSRSEVSASHATGGETILVVEDEAGIRMTVTRQLQVSGYGVATADNGREALAHLAKGPLPAMILLDLSMPEMDGWAFRIEQQKDPRLASIPVVVASAIYDPAPAAAMARADAFLAKPYDLEMLLATARRFCG